MSQLKGTQESATSGRYSKRKRTQINYYGNDSDTESGPQEDESQHIVAYQPSKKRRATRPLPKRKVFPFLKLPAEIRNIIYGHCLSDPAGVKLIAVTKKYRRTVERTHVLPQRTTYGRYYHGSPTPDDEPEPTLQPFVPSLLAVNKQIYKEGRDILYGNDFILEEPIALHSFINDIMPRAASLLKTITLTNWGRYRGMQKAYNHSSFCMLTSATNIEQLTINGSLYCGSEPKAVARQIYRDAFSWLEAVGAAKGSIDAAVSLIDISQNNFRRWGYWRNQNQPTSTLSEEEQHEKDMGDFRVELSRLLTAHMKKIRSKPSKKTK